MSKKQTIGGKEYYQIETIAPDWARWRVKLLHMKNDYDFYKLYLDSRKEYLAECAKMKGLGREAPQTEFSALEGLYEDVYNSCIPATGDLEVFINKNIPKLKFKLVLLDDDVFIYTKRKITKSEEGYIFGYCEGMNRVRNRLGR